MTMSRYTNRTIFTNSTESYRIYLQDRNLKKISHYSTPKMKYPTEEQISNLEIIAHVWTWGDELYLLSHKYYGTTEYWWVIAWFNKKGSQMDIELGDTIYVPKPLERILIYYGV